MKVCLLLLMGVMLTTVPMMATTVSYEISGLGRDSSGEMLYTYTYRVSGVTLQNLQELDMYFSSAVFNTLSDSFAGPAFQTVLFQPNNPPGAPGDFGIIPNSNNSVVVTGPLSVDFTLLNSALPGSQDYTVTQYLPSGVSAGIIASGTTVPVSATPEPSSLVLTAIALLVSTVLGAARLVRVRHPE